MIIVWILWLHVWSGGQYDPPIVALLGVYKTEEGCKGAVKKLHNDSKSWGDCSMEQVQP